MKMDWGNVTDMSQRCDNKRQSKILDQERVLNGEIDIGIRSLDSLTVRNYYSFPVLIIVLGLYKMWKNK